jgi:hypothetical protein
MSTDLPGSPWLQAVVFRTVRAIEERDGAMDDGDAVREAAVAARAPERRLSLRAWALGQRLKLADEIEHARAAMPWLLLATALVAGWLSLQVLSLVTGEDRRINAVGALAAVLLPPTLSLVLWCLSLLWRGQRSGGGLARWALAAAAHVPGLRTAHSVQLFQAGVQTLAQAHLLPWAIGLANHLVWIGALVCILLGLLYALSFRAYTLTWETTILAPEFFAGLVTATGYLPGRLGLPVPDTAAALAGHSAAGDPAPWGWWLIGCAFVYGLLPRVVAALWCWMVCRRRRSGLRLAIEATDPYTRNLLGRFARWDDETAAARADDLAPSHLVAALGFELPPELDWPLAALPPEQGWVGRIAGTFDERQETLDRLARMRPGRVLIVCWSNATPDRGTARFLAQAVPCSGRAALLLLGSAPATRWQAWLVTVQLDGVLPVYTDAARAQTWLGERTDA